MKNGVRHFPESEFISYANTGSLLAAGKLVDLGARFGIVQDDIAATTGVGTLHLHGEFELPANTGAGTDFVVGEAVYYDVTNSRCDKVGTPTAKYVGMCMKAKATTDSTIRVNLNAGSNSNREVHVVTSGEASANTGKGRCDLTGYATWVGVKNLEVSVRRVTTGNNQSSFAVTVGTPGTVRVDGISSGDLAAGDLVFVRVLG